MIQLSFYQVSDPLVGDRGQRTVTNAFLVNMNDTPSQRLTVPFIDILWEDVAGRADGSTIRPHHGHMSLILDES